MYKDKEGWMWKRKPRATDRDKNKKGTRMIGNLIPSFLKSPYKRRWMVLNTHNRLLTYYTDPEKQNYKGQINLADIIGVTVVKEIEDRDACPTAFRLSVETHDRGACSFA